MQTPGVSSGRMLVGMTPKTLRLPKQCEMLLSVHDSPLGVYKENNMVLVFFNTLKDDIQITMLNKLDVSTKVFNVKVRIIRLWKNMSYMLQGQVHTVEMVLVDEEGNKMLGSIINEHWQNFKNLIELNSTILITKASLAENHAANKFMGNPNKVSFNHETNIVELNDFLGEPYGFTFASFEDMNNNLFPPFHTVDIIGYITSSEKPTTFLGKGGESTLKVIVHLEDLKLMTDYISNNPDKTNVVIILQFGRFKFWGEKTWASNNYVYSKLFIDEDIQAIISFKQRLIEQTSGLTGSSQKSIGTSVNCSVEDDFLIKTEFNNIAEVHMKTVRLVVILGTIKFRILIRVQDPTGIIDLTLWDREAVKILKVSANDLVESIIKGETSEQFPDVLNNLLEKKYAFKIDIKKYNVDRQEMGFGISKYSDDSKIIDTLENKFNLEQVCINFHMIKWY
ncbi:uncharacterized protein LOC143535409 [Bidens hawaiensis]|uniref:uncharacterized protein LOC143535409 n=1 Tax=Bidens hawaiensis TaxID=980011 RepID=UPI00404A7FD4